MASITTETCSDIGQIKKKFVHLHLHTTYSLLDGAQLIGDVKNPKKEFGLLNKLQSLGMDAVAITDHGNMFGAIDFFKKATSAGIKPIMGCETYLAPVSRLSKEKGRFTDRIYYHQLILARNNTGYRNLSKLVTSGFFEGFHYRPRIDKEILRQHAEGLIGTSSCLAGEVCQLLLKGRDEEALAAAKEYAQIFNGYYYIELQMNGIAEQMAVNPKLVQIARELGLGLVATNDVHYMAREDAEAQDALLAIQTGKTISDPNRLKHDVQEFYLKSPDEMWELFKEWPDACENTIKIAEMCDVNLKTKDYYFPKLDKGDGVSNMDALRADSLKGLEARLKVVLAQNPPEKHDDLRKEYFDRLEYELQMIQKMGFADYFLIVSDFINWAKDHDIPVGPGRGSAAGSLVAFCTRITDIDPIKHSLLFERFLNPERVSMPDIDVDFCESRRDEVIQYVRERYAVPGGPAVSQIITFGKLKAKAVLKDVGRAMDISFNETNRLAKLIPNVLDITLDDALQQEPRLREEIKENPRLAKLFDIARRLEGLNRHASVHAAGVVISDGRPLVEHLPLYKGAKGEVVTQFDMKGVESVGLIKFDFLGLKNLTLIKNCLDLIKQNRGVTVDMETINIEDPAVFDLLCHADTLGVFQLESSGMRQLITRLRPSCFEDVIALVALYRPGPLQSGMADSFILRKHGQEKIDYIFDVLQPVLGSTYGVCIYQEQVMQIANVLASYSLGEADILRRAMGKKDALEMEKQRSRFVEGAQKNGFDTAKAEDLFGKVEKFAAYGFNRCLAGDTEILDAQTGERTTLAELHATPRPFSIHALGNDWKIHTRSVSDVIDNGIQPTFELKTALGKTITATANHPFRTLQGWTLLENLQVGTRIAAPRQSLRLEPHADTVPAEVIEQINQARLQSDLSWEQIESQIDLRLPKTLDEAQKSNGFRRTTIQKLATFFSSTHLQYLGDSEIYWDTVVSITPKGAQRTYDLTVEHDHNFVANGLIVHNSHSAAYGLVAYQTAWLKAHYRHEYMAALLTADAGNSDKLLLYLNDCRQHKVQVLPPNVNESHGGFVAIGDRIRFGLAGIKGIGENAIDAIIQARRSGQFTGIYDFCERVDLKPVNKRVIEALIKSGAFDGIEPINRASLVAVMDDAVQYGQSLQKDKGSNQISMFDILASSAPPPKPKIPLLKDWPEKERLQQEKEILGFYISGHPLQRLEKDLKRFVTANIADLSDYPSGSEVTIAGIITSKRGMVTKKGDPMAFVMIEDMTGTIEVSVFPRLYSEVASLLDSDEPVLVRGETESDENQVRMKGVELRSLIAARNEKAREVHLHLTSADLSEAAARQMLQILHQHQGSCLALLHLTIPQRSETLIRLPEHIRVDPSESFEEAIENLFGPRALSLR
jgi:DNA polymerase-3 subunit alpha